MKIKLKKPVQGKTGEYPADTWLEAKDIDGFIFITEGTSPNMKLKLVAKSNIKEKKE